MRSRIRHKDFREPWLSKLLWSKFLHFRWRWQDRLLQKSSKGFEFAKKANELVSPECKEFFADQSDLDVEAEVQSWEEACKEVNAAAGDANQDDADDGDDAQQALDDAAKDAKDAATTATDEVQEIVDDAKDDIAKVTDGAFTVSTIFSALALFAALY